MNSRYWPKLSTQGWATETRVSEATRGRPGQLLYSELPLIPQPERDAEASGGAPLDAARCVSRIEDRTTPDAGHAERPHEGPGQWPLDDGCRPATHPVTLLPVEVPQVEGRARCDAGLEARAEARRAERNLRGDLPEGADPVLHDRYALAVGDQAGIGVEDADRHAGAACAALQAEFERRGPVRPHGRPSPVARCAAEPGHAELRGDPPLTRDAGRAGRKTEPGEYGGRFQIHFIPKVIQPFVALFWPFTIQL